MGDGRSWLPTRVLQVAVGAVLAAGRCAGVDTATGAHHAHTACWCGVVRRYVASIMYSVTNRRTLEDAEFVHDNLLTNLMGTTEDIPIVLVGNKCDLDSERCVCPTLRAHARSRPSRAAHADTRVRVQASVAAGRADTRLEMGLSFHRGVGQKERARGCVRRVCLPPCPRPAAGSPLARRSLSASVRRVACRRRGVQPVARSNLQGRVQPAQEALMAYVRQP